MRDNKEMIWVGFPDALLRLDINNAENTKVVLQASDVKQSDFHYKTKDVWSLYQDINGKIWAGTQEGGLIYLCDSNTTTCFLNVDARSTLSTATIYHIGEDQKGQVWLCTSEGFFQFDPTEEQVTPYISTNNNTDIRTVYHFYEDTGSVYWLACAEGLLRWDRNTSEQRLFTRANGLSNNTIYAVYGDQYGHLWLSSDYGIMQFNKENHMVRNYLPHNGIAHYEFNRISHLQDTDGTIYFGSLNGITAFHPDDFYETRIGPPPQLVIIDFQQFDGKANRLVNRRKDVRSHKTVFMKPEDSFFQMELALLAYKDVDLIQYATKVEGIDQDWHLLEGNVLHQGRLPYGTHQLKLKARMPSGEWSKNELDIKVHMLKPFYLKNPFIFLSLLVFAGIVFVYNRFRVGQFRKRQKILEKKIYQATEQIRKDKEIIEEQAKKFAQVRCC